jgi:hypothetical protein
MKRKVKDRAYIANYPELKAWIDKHEMRCNWQLPCGGDPEDPRAFVESYSAPGRRECIVVVRSDGIGWELYTPIASTKIDETLADADKRLDIATGNRKLTLGERIDRAVEAGQLDSLGQLRILREAGLLKEGES